MKDEVERLRARVAELEDENRNLRQEILRRGDCDNAAQRSWKLLHSHHFAEFGDFVVFTKQVAYDVYDDLRSAQDPGYPGADAQETMPMWARNWADGGERCSHCGCFYVAREPFCPRCEKPAQVRDVVLTHAARRAAQRGFTGPSVYRNSRGEALCALLDAEPSVTHSGVVHESWEFPDKSRITLRLVSWEVSTIQ